MAVDPIVVGTDGSITAEHAVDKAGELAASLEAAVHVVCGYDPVGTGALIASAGGVVISDTISGEEAQAEAEEIAGRASRRLVERGVDARAHACLGNPAEALMEVADAVGAQMIVVGNRGMTGARRLLGSVPNTVSHQARCGVLIVPTS